MLYEYETSSKKPGSAAGKPPVKPAQHTTKPQPATAVKKVQSAPVPVKQIKAPHTPGVRAAYPRQQHAAHKASAAPKTGQATIKGFPSRQKAIHTTVVARHPHPGPALHKSHPSGTSGKVHRRPIGSTIVTGFPHHGHGARKYRAAGTTVHPRRVAPAGTLTARHATVTGRPHYRKHVHRPAVASMYPRRIHRYAHRVRPGYAPQPGIQYTGIRRPHHYRAGVPATYVTGNVSSTVPVGCPAPQSYNTVPSTPVAQPHVCHTCGSGTKGCTTLSRFAFNSSALKGDHLNKIRVLAARILNENLNAVVVTGHTDSSGTEDYNEALGGKRASAVISQLKKQIKMLKPDAYRNIFWRTDSKGESQPLAQNDAAANRRVEICLRRINIIA